MQELYMYDDEREIDQINDYQKQFTIARVGIDGVTKIVCYPEKGSLDFFPYLAIYKGDFLYQRVAAIGISVIYKS